MGTRVIGRAPRATETTGREAVAVLEADFAARLAAGRRGRRRRRLRRLLDIPLGRARETVLRATFRAALHGRSFLRHANRFALELRLENDGLLTGRRPNRILIPRFAFVKTDGITGSERPPT